MHKVRDLVVVMSIALIALGCKGTDEGLVGIVFNNGTECLGEEAQPIKGDTIYVSPDGDDDYAGNTPESPLRTLAQALCNVRPGQTVRIMPGTYRESVIMGAFGSNSAMITIQGVSDGEQLPVLDGESNRTMGIALVECTNITVENLEFRNYSDEGLFVLLGSDIMIHNNRFIANGRASIDSDLEEEGFGVNVEEAQRVTIAGNEAAENGPAADRVKRGILGTGINTFGLQDAVIRDNHAYNNIGGGILVEDGVNVSVENNQVDNNELDAAGDYWDGGIWVDGGHDVTLRGNTITDNHGPGIQISDEDVQYPGSSFGYHVEDNLITANLFGIYLWNFGQCPLPSTEIVGFSNNTIRDNARRDIWCEEWTCGERQACD